MPSHGVGRHAFEYTCSNVGDLLPKRGMPSELHHTPVRTVVCDASVADVVVVVVVDVAGAEHVPRGISSLARDLAQLLVAVLVAV